ncbi:MAG: LVIVD repeat-containing protein [Candidatus Thorarchaeota archaeon]
MKRRDSLVICGITAILLLFLIIDNSYASVDNSRVVILQELGQIDTPGLARDVIIRGDIAYVADMGSPTSTYGGLLIFNVSEPENPTEMGYFYDGGRSHHLFIKEDIILIADNTGGLEIINVSDPFDPQKIGEFPGVINDLDVQGNIVYATDFYEGLIVLDISNITHPTEIGRFENLVSAQPITVVNNLAFVTDSNGLKILNVTDASNIAEIANYNFRVSNLQFHDNTAYVVCSHAQADPSDGFKILDTNNLLNITEVGAFHDGGKLIDLAVNHAESAAIVSDRDDGIEVIDIRDPFHLTKIGQYYDGGNATNIQVVGDLLFVADGVDGLEIIKIEYKSAASSSCSAFSSLSSDTKSSGPGFELSLLLLSLFSLPVLRKWKTRRKKRES